MLHFWTKVLRKLCGPKGKEVNAGGEPCMTRSFIMWVLEEIALA